MRINQLVFVIVTGMMSCSRADPDPYASENAYALLNDQPWSGFTTVQQNNATCGANTVNIYIQNKLPYPTNARLQALALCGGYCGDQSLVFNQVPMAVGTYNLSAVQPCSDKVDRVGVSFTTRIGGDILRDQYQPTSVNAGTLTITRYNRSEVEGTFEVSLVRDKSRQVVSDAADTIRLTRSQFRVRL